MGITGMGIRWGAAGGPDGWQVQGEYPISQDHAPEAFFDRRRFLSRLGGLGLGLLATPALFRASETAVTAQTRLLQPPLERPDVFPATRNQAYTIPSAIERRDLMAREIAASHNNFYEFLPGKGGPRLEVRRGF